MFSDVAHVRSETTERLQAVLPDSWRFVDSVDDVIEAIVPVVYIRFTSFESTVNGSPLPYGVVGAGLSVQVATPKTETGPAEDDVDQHVLTLIRVMDPMTDIFWSRAEKGRLPNGPMAWDISLVALTYTKE